MKVEIIPCLQDNYSYLIIDEDKLEACVVDPSEAKPIIDYLSGKNIKLKYILNTPGDQFGVYGNNSKILEETKWKPNYNLKTGLINMVNWAKKKSK